MLAVALEAEVDDYVTALADERDGNGRLTANGHAGRRTITTAAGGIEIEAPRIDDKRVDEVTGERCGLKSVIVPPWCRKSPKVSEVLPLMYLHGMSSGDFASALAASVSSTRDPRPWWPTDAGGARCVASCAPRCVRKERHRSAR